MHRQLARKIPIKNKMKNKKYSDTFLKRNKINIKKLKN